MGGTGDPYSFVKGGDFFGPCSSWPTLSTVLGHEWDADKLTLTLKLQRPDQPDGEPCLMQLLLLQQNLFRVRINPKHLREDDFTRTNTRTIVQDSFDDLRRILEDRLPFTANFVSAATQLELTTHPQIKEPLSHGGGSETRPTMRIIVDLAPLQVTVFDCSAPADAPPVWRTARPGIRYTANGDDDFCIIQAVEKPADVRYVGFGEQGGTALFKQSAQLVYFNYDNMRYRQVYNQGPLDNREPLYHSDPFFMAFNSRPGIDSVYGLFIDNAGQVCVDVGSHIADSYLLGTRFNDLDFYFVLGSQPSEVLTDYTALVGRPQLRPRYALGYHQGCFGYKKRQDLESIVDSYRRHNIPLDGLAVDVDVQRKYKTFTIDETKFPDPRGMFAGLRQKGIKCCTNITPIISKEDTDGYTTYHEARENGFFVLDMRYEPNSNYSKSAQFYNGGQSKLISFNDWDDESKKNYNSGQPYIGKVWYGGYQMTTGHYPDLARREVRDWWGQQYKHLFDQGLEFVWQDMTTPAIPVFEDRVPYGDMKGFPFRLMVADNFLSGASKEQRDEKCMAIKVWNLYSYNLHKATYHGLNHLPGRENKRNFIVGRGCFSGMHRFAALWTGDNASEWDFLRINVTQVLSLGMCGQALSGQDIGGFESAGSDQWADPALLIRWTIAGAFLPWFRNHYNRNSKCFQEPFNFVEWFNTDEAHSKGFYKLPEPQDLYLKVVPICRHYISLRYRLLQLFYDLLWQNMLDGMPICRPLFLNDPKDNALYNDQLQRCNDQFFVGRDLLVAPVLEPENQPNQSDRGRRPVYLPATSKWYSFMDNTLPLGPAQAGGTTVNFNATLDFSLDSDRIHMQFLCPLYVREGGVLPTIPLEQFVGQLNSMGKACPITYNIYPGRLGDYHAYLDDGVSRSSAPADAPQFKFGGAPDTAKSEYRHVYLQHALAADGLNRTITLKRLHDLYTPRFEDHYFVALLHDPAEQNSVAGAPLLSVTRAAVMPGRLSDSSIAAQVQSRDALEAAASTAWWFDSTARVTYVKVPDTAATIELQAKYVARPPWA